jgi:hypothetical protein
MPASRRGGWEVIAADGFKLRCDWFRIDNEVLITFAAIAPQSGALTSVRT